MSCHPALRSVRYSCVLPLPLPPFYFPVFLTRLILTNTFLLKRCLMWGIRCNKVLIVQFLLGARSPFAPLLIRKVLSSSDESVKSSQPLPLVCVFISSEPWLRLPSRSPTDPNPIPIEAFKKNLRRKQRRDCLLGWLSS